MHKKDQELNDLKSDFKTKFIQPLLNRVKNIKPDEIKKITDPLGLSELKDDEILEILMTSDFVENLRPEDYKYLLFKFRSFYKLLHGNYQRYKNEKEFIINNLKIDISNIAKLFRIILNLIIKSVNILC